MQRTKATYYARRFIQEIMEAVVALTVLSLYTKRTIDSASQILANSVFVGLVTLFLEETNKDILTNFKQGMAFTLGASMLV